MNIVDSLSIVRLPSDREIALEIPTILFLVYKARGGSFEMDFPMASELGRENFVYWWMNFGKHEYKFTDLFISDYNKQRMSDRVGSQFDGFCWTRLMRMAFSLEKYFNDTHLVRPIPIGTMEGMKWFYTSLAPRRRLAEFLSVSELKKLMTPVSVENPELTQFLKFYWDIHPTLQADFPLETASSIDAYIEHFHVHELTLDDKGLFLEAANRRIGSFQLHNQQMNVKSQADGSPKEIVNIVGLASSVSGIGQDARMASASCAAADINFCVSPFPAEIKSHLSSHVNLFCLSGFQLMLAAAIAGRDLFDNAFNIGFFPWELPDWPQDLNPALDTCDEIWCSSEFIREAVAGATRRPTRVMPMAVEIEETEFRPRSFFDLPEDAIIFNFIFDFVSGSERKNIWGCIEAFLRAFPKESSDDVRLVIKSMNHKDEMPEYLRLVELCEQDSRIVHFKGEMSRRDVLSLMNASDVFLSLHRAEGFGRCLAESMLLGKHVVATNYSGNLVFCKPEFTYLVDYDLVPVKSTEYFLSENQVWADAKMQSAVEQIRLCTSAIRRGEGFNQLGQSYISQNYSKEAVGAKYRERLSELGLLT